MKGLPALTQPTALYIIVLDFIQTETLTDLLDLLTRMPGLCIKQTDFNPSASVALFGLLRLMI